MPLVHCDVYSDVLQLSCSLCVILPQAGAEERRALQSGRLRYPTLYLLHGLSDDHTIWQRRTSVERYAEPLKLAVVMPAVHRSFYADMACGYRYWTYVSEEVPAVARAFFPLSAARADNFVAGLSMGGYGAFKLALACPERFAAAASLSGALDMARIAAEESRQAEMRLVFRNPKRLGGTPDDLFSLARRAVRRKVRLPRLYQWCGASDHLYQDNLRFRDLARSLGLPLTYEDGPGDHSWGCWDDQIRKVMEWLPLRGRGVR
jgi:S-formylglutathione hydrolase FrmB